MIQVCYEQTKFIMMQVPMNLLSNAWKILFEKVSLQCFTFEHSNMLEVPYP